MAGSHLTEPPNFHWIMQSEKCSYLWTLPDFTNLIVTKYGCVKSPYFTIGLHKWYLKFYPHGTVSKPAYVGIFLRPETSVTSKIFVTMKCRLTDNKNNLIRLWCTEGVFSPRTSDTLGTCSLYEQKALRERVPDKVVKLDVEVAIGPTQQRGLRFVGHNENRTMENTEMKLIEDLFLFLENKKLADLIIHVRGIDMQAHSQILAARSPVFAAMFSYNTMENITRRIDIPDFEPKTIQHLLDFMYTSHVKDLDVVEAEELLKASDKYAIYDLKELCADFLCSNFDTSNVMGILLLADMHNSKRLKQKALDFICSNKQDFMNIEVYRPVIDLNPQIIAELLVKSLSQLQNKE